MFGRVWLTYSFLLGWVGGGITLLAMLVMRTALRPYALALGLLGYAFTGFVCTGLGREPRALFALAGGALAAALGYGIGRLQPAPRDLPLDLR
jgi:VIT1/CCC1 family predicted Fe2+/Mn2+ transporter